MKQLVRFLVRPIFLVIPILMLGTISISCDDDDDPTPSSDTVVYTAALTGASERPDPTPSTATGTATLTFNKSTKIFTLTVTHSELTLTGAHIHKGAPDVAGDVVFPLDHTISPIIYTSGALDATEEADLKNGLYYVNLHTAAYPNGEIRGQLLPPTSVFTATLTGANERPTPTPSTATGTATLTFDNATKVFTLTVTYSVLTLTGAHIHKGAADVAGDVVFPLVHTANPIMYTSGALDATQEADLKNGLYYVNLHTAAYPNGEIRGQLMKQTSGNGGGGY